MVRSWGSFPFLPSLPFRLASQTLILFDSQVRTVVSDEYIVLPFSKETNKGFISGRLSKY